jgi:hypothetical protein
MKTLACIFVGVLVTTSIPAQQLPLNQEQILVPIAPTGRAAVPGAFGSSWETDLTIANGGDAPVTVFGLPTPICPVLCPAAPPDPIPPKATIFASTERCSAAAGLILIADRSTADDLFFTLRSHDTSRDDRAWGSIVPVVRTRDRFSRPFSIVDVPIDGRFRPLLRLYATNGAAPASVRVRFFAEDPASAFLGIARADVLISEVTPVFATGTAPFCPAYAEVALSQVPSLVPLPSAFPNANRIRIEVVPALDPLILPIDTAQQYWGFVSVTNNDTQEVSIIRPN